MEAVALTKSNALAFMSLVGHGPWRSAGRRTRRDGAGTAAVISPVGKISYKGLEYVIGSEAGPWSTKLYQTLTGIQTGKLPDKHGWVYKVI